MSHPDRSASVAVRKQTTSILALAGLGLAVALLVQTATPAAARQMSRCQIKHSYCSERCIMKNSGDGIGACVQRTCDRQNPGCGPDSWNGKGNGRAVSGANPRRIAVPGSGRDTTPSRPAGGVVTSSTPRPSGTGNTVPIRNSGVNATSRSERGGVAVRSESRRVRR